GRAIAAGRPKAAAPPAGIRIVDAAIEALGIEAHWIGDADGDHLAVFGGGNALHQIGARHRNVLAEPERVVLIDPGVIARLGAILAEALEAGSGILIRIPAFGTMVAVRGRG